MKDLKIISPDKNKHREMIFDLTAKTFLTYFYFRSVCDTYFDPKTYDWKASRVGMVGDDIVSHLGVWKLQTRYGQSRLRIAGIGAVSTHDKHRKKDVMRETFKSFLSSAGDRGYDLSLLFGIQNFYTKFGYVRAWPNEDWLIRRNALLEAKPTIRTKRFKKVDPEMDQLYNRTNRKIAGTMIRPFYGERAIKENKVGVKWGEKKLEGYVIVDKAIDDLILLDYAGKPDIVLKVLRKLATNFGYQRVKIHNMQYHSPLCQALRGYACEYIVKYTPTGEAMVKTISLAGALASLKKELTARVISSAVNREAMVTIKSREENVTLEITKKGVEISKKQQKKNIINAGDHSARLLIGSADPGEMIATGDISVKGEGGFWAPILFPYLNPNLPSVDRF